MIDLDDYIPLDECDNYFNKYVNCDIKPFDYLEYERHYFEPGGIYILFTYSNN